MSLGAHSALLSMLIVTCSFFYSGVAVSKESVLQFQSSGDTKIRTLISENFDKSKANLVLLVGGSGILKISTKGEIKRETENFLVRERNKFVERGYLTALVDAPLDRKNRIQLLEGFRASKQHADDLEIVAKKLFALNGKPVIAIGTSRGTVSAANLGLRDNSGTVKAVILTSSLVRKNRKGKNLNDQKLEKLKLPLLFIHNKNDSCPATLLKDVQPLAARLKKSGTEVELVTVQSVHTSGEECKGSSPHGFLGIEDEVITVIDRWILSNVLHSN